MIENEGFHVSGQLYLVDAQAMRSMDELERLNEPDGYYKTTIDVVNQLSRKVCSASVYVKRPAQLTDNIIQLGPLRSYESEHAALYQPRKVNQSRKNNRNVKSSGSEL